MPTVSNKSNTYRRSKFTRGEKCIFWHIVVTFVLLIALLMVYFVHLLWLNHTGTQAFIPYTREMESLDAVLEKEEISVHPPIGIVYVQPNTLMCNSLLIRHRWSLAPAQCVAAREEVDLSDLLMNWRIKYKADLLTEDYIETTIKRSIAHPHFDSDNLRNNVGVFEHDEYLTIYSFSFPGAMTLSGNPLVTNGNDLEIIGWEDSWQEPGGELIHNSVRHLNSVTCSIYANPITELRDYEYCFTLTARRNVSIVIGAVLAINSTFVGFFSWGDTQGRGVPLIVLDCMHFKDWIRHIISI